MKRERGGLLGGFLPALKGLTHLVRSERHSKFHLLATFGVVIGGLVVNVSRNDWLWLTLAIALVWITEALNTAIERLADRVTGDYDPLIGQAKDLAAGAVLVAAVFAAVTAIAVFV